ncbi:Stp1/IreP family PP2C-type Ser/Thr phosphatase [Crenothrix sp.]|uniref:Stp1/IreP family PP2C-type Ser/Thr phosphatase n=1 Tax=Crenothrix sp. TaxID=3100433 RepID=UPI00374D4E48
MKKFFNGWFKTKPPHGRALASSAILTHYFPEIGLFSDVGLERVDNQDSIGCLRFSDKRNFLVVLADGMGGHQGGEVASQIAVHTVQKSFPAPDGSQDLIETLQASFKTANTAIYQLSLNTPELSGMGTTLVVLVVVNGLAYYANTGDSRLYWFRNGDCIQLSRDHTRIAYMVETGLVPAELASHHPDRHLLTRAIGTKIDENIEICYKPIPIELSDSFLLCSDGLYELVSNDEMNSVLNHYPAQEACQYLVELANNRGGYDNISVIVVKITPNRPTINDGPITRV